MWLIRSSVRRPVLTSVISIILIFLGLYSYFGIGVALLPNIEIPVVMVRMNYKGAGPQEIERLIVAPIEDAISTVEGIETVRAMAREGVGIVIAELAYGTNPTVAAMDIGTRVRAQANRFPENADEPIVDKFDINAQEFMTIVANSEYPASQIRDLIEENVARRLTQITGMANADVYGGRRREIQIEVDPLKLRAHNLSVARLGTLLATTNENTPIGTIAAGQKEVSLRMIGEPIEPSDIENITISLEDGKVIRIGDIAKVRDTLTEERRRARFNGRESVMVDLVARPNANVIQIAQEVRRTLGEIENRLPEGIDLQIIYDNSQIIKESVDNVIRDMVMGTLLTALFLFLFLQRFGATLAVVVTLPTSIISTFIILRLYNFTLNTMSAMGLAISVGVLVDNAILVLENIYRYREMGYSPADASEKGAIEIAVAILANVATNLGVFIPVAFMGGMVGSFFYEFALTVVFSTVMSLYASFSLTPMIATYFGGSIGKTSLFARVTTGWWQYLFNDLNRMSFAIVRYTIKHPLLTLLAFAAISTAAFMGIPQAGFEMIARQDEGLISIAVTLSSTASLEATDEVVRGIETHIKANPYVRDISASAGGGGRLSAVNSGRINVYLIDAKDRPSAFEIISEWRTKFAAIPDADISVNVRSSRGMGGFGKPVRISIAGHEVNELNRISEEVMTAMRETPGLVDIDTDFRLGREEIRFSPRFNRLSELGVSLRNVADEANGYVTGYKSGYFRNMGYEYDVIIILEPEWRSNAIRLASVPIWTPRGLVPLDVLMNTEVGMGPTMISRESRQRTVTVDANVSSGYTVGDAMTSIVPKLESIELPMGYRLIYGGEVKSIQDNFRRLLVAFAMAVSVTFLIIAGLLESYIFAIIIILCVPISIVGIMPMMLATGTTFSLFSLLGIVMLVGIVVNNAIVIVDFAEMRRRSGVNYTKAIIEASKTRFRPILMVTITTVVAVIPMAMTTGAGAMDRAPMAIVLIGGMIGGGFLTLYLIPPVYNTVWAIKTYFNKK
ncbi:MAG: efflux RND transporter permease subunit [Synergistaceae bacterium]|nr:efflux RND transporter permease subunit [Synergistaceae bacterium]